jgi:hypothetical protein
MIKNRFRDAFGYYNAVRKVLSKQNKSEKLDNELTPEEEKKYISYEKLMSVPQKVKKILMDTYGEVFLSNNELSKLTKAKRLIYGLSLTMSLYILTSIIRCVSCGQQCICDPWTRVTIFKEQSYI